MRPSSRTPEGLPGDCPVCGSAICIEPSIPPGDATCPNCGHLVWFDSPTGAVELVYSVHQAARLCKVSPQTIVRSFDSGELCGYLAGGGRRFRRIPRSNLLEFMAVHGISSSTA